MEIKSTRKLAQDIARNIFFVASGYDESGAVPAKEMQLYGGKENKVTLGRFSESSLEDQIRYFIDKLYDESEL